MNEQIIKSDDLLLLDQLKAIVGQGMSKGLLVNSQLRRIVQLIVEAAQGPCTIEFSERISVSTQTLFSEISSMITSATASVAGGAAADAPAVFLTNSQTNQPEFSSGHPMSKRPTETCQDRFASGCLAVA